MPVQPVSGPTLPEDIEGSKVEEEEGLVEKKTEEVAAPALERGVLPEAPPPLLSQHEITVMSSTPLPLDLSPETVEKALDSILDEKGISETANIGIEAVAARRLNEEINALLESCGYPPVCPESAVQSVSGVDFIFSGEGVTVTGIDKEALPAFVETLRVSDPHLVDEVEKLQQEGEVACVSDEMVSTTEQAADDRFSEIATELRDRLEGTTGAEESPETEEESTEGSEGSEEEVEAEEPEAFESEEEITDVEEAEEAETSESEEGSSGQPSSNVITRTSVEAATIDRVVAKIIHKFIEKNMWSEQRKAEKHYREERQQEKREEEEERKDEQLGDEVLKQDIKRDEQKKADAKSERRREEVEKQAIRSSSSKAEERHDIGEYVEKLKVGEPMPPPSTPIK